MSEKFYSCKLVPRMLIYYLDIIELNLMNYSNNQPIIYFYDIPYF
jgi:hypothetical protein